MVARSPGPTSASGSSASGVGDGRREVLAAGPGAAAPGDQQQLAVFELRQQRLDPLQPLAIEQQRGRRRVGQRKGHLGPVHQAFSETAMAPIAWQAHQPRLHSG